MKRSIFVVLVFCVLVSPAAWAVDVPSLITKAEAALESVTEPATRAEILVGLLTLDEATGNNNKAAEHFAALQKLVAEATDPKLKAGLIDAAAGVALERQDYSAAFTLVDQIPDESQRLRGSVLLAGQVIASSEKSDFDIAPVLESLLPRLKSYPDLTAVAHAFLGRCYAKKGNADAAKVAFAEAVKIAKTLESLEEQNVLGMVVTLQVVAGMRDAAVEIATSQSVPATGQYLLGMIALSGIKTGEVKAGVLPWEKTLAMITDAEIREAVCGAAVESLIDLGRLSEAIETAAAPLEAAAGIADTLTDPHERAFAYVRIAHVQTSLAKAQQELQKPE